ncbi:MAG: DUF192 domain-containing protein [Actinobacteria bacterium]|nr:DUF192 domain-containing protein [Actinomycetota bacterium]
MDYDDEPPRPRLHLRIIAIAIAIALLLPVLIGTGVVIYRSLTDNRELPALEMERSPIPPFRSVRFRVGDGDDLYCALLAATDQAQQQGMQQRSDLGGYDAMVFAFGADVATAFTNHFVPIDLSIGWFDARGRLVDQTTMDACPDGNDCPTYASKDPFRYAIETPVGGLSALGLAGSGSVVHVGGGCS